MTSRMAFTQRARAEDAHQGGYERSRDARVHNEWQMEDCDGGGKYQECRGHARLRYLQFEPAEDGKAQDRPIKENPAGSDDAHLRGEEPSIERLIRAQPEVAELA